MIYKSFVVLCSIIAVDSVDVFPLKCNLILVGMFKKHEQCDWELLEKYFWWI